MLYFPNGLAARLAGGLVGLVVKQERLPGSRKGEGDIQPRKIYPSGHDLVEGKLMSIIQIVNGKPCMSWYWAIAVWLVIVVLMVSVVFGSLMLWVSAYNVAPVPPGLIISTIVLCGAASFLVFRLTMQWILRTD